MALEIRRRFNEKELPDVNSLSSEVDKLAKETVIGETLFIKKFGVKSEVEYKWRCAAEGRVMKHSPIGWNSWEVTAEGLRKIYTSLNDNGSYIDRFGLALDWIMGVPRELRDKVPAGTGLIFETPEQWNAVGQIVPVQPHFGDHMIGSLNSLENTRLALGAGVTTIGNISQYYIYEYPGIEREKERTEDMVRAIMLMGRFAEAGTIVHSNLDDGFGGQFHDLANMVGWAMLERYIIEDLAGARLGHCFGNLFSNPMQRIIFNCAMNKINKYGTPGSMIYGNTIDCGPNFARNSGSMGSYSLADAMGQLKYPSGHAINPIPVTEAIRIPAADEIIDAHRLVDMMIEKAPLYSTFIDWDRVESETEILVSNGLTFFERVLNCLGDLRVDITHPGQLLGVLKAMAPEQMETEFGAGQKDINALRGRVPLRPTSVVETISGLKQKIIDKQKVFLKTEPLRGLNVIIGSTDVHEFGKDVCKGIVQEAGATVFDLGTTVAPAEFIDAIKETGSKVILVSTYNGIALSYAKELLDAFSRNNCAVKLIMGGLINENMDGSDLPVDVTKEITALGINCENDADKLVQQIIDAIDK